MAVVGESLVKAEEVAASRGQAEGEGPESRAGITGRRKYGVVEVGHLSVPAQPFCCP